MFRRFLKFLFTGNLVFDGDFNEMELHDGFGVINISAQPLLVKSKYFLGDFKVILSKTYFEKSIILTKTRITSAQYSDMPFWVNYSDNYLLPNNYKFCIKGLRQLYGYIPNHIYFAIENK